jgi:hypothetical protein
MNNTNLKGKETTMMTLAHMKPSTAVTVLLLTLVAIAHIVRLFYHMSVTVNAVAIPVWVSVMGVIIAGGLAIWLWSENSK